MRRVAESDRQNPAVLRRHPQERALVNRKPECPVNSAQAGVDGGERGFSRDHEVAGTAPGATVAVDSAGRNPRKLGKKVRRRFTRDRANELWIGDFEHGPDKMHEGEPVSTRLSAFIDRHSRLSRTGLSGPPPVRPSCPLGARWKTGREGSEEKSEYNTREATTPTLPTASTCATTWRRSPSSRPLPTSTSR